MNKLKTPHPQNILSLGGNTKLSSITDNIMQIPIPRHQSENISIRRYQDWTYASTTSHDSGNSMTPSNGAFKFLPMFVTNICQLHLSTVTTTFLSEVNEYLTPPLSHDIRINMTMDIFRMLKRLLRNTNGNNIHCRIISDYYSFLMDATIYTDNNIMTFTTSLFDGNKILCKCCMDTIPMENNAYITRLGGTPFYLSKKNKDAEAAIRNESDIKITDDITIKLIHQALQFMIDHKNKPFEQVGIFHTTSEMYFIKKMIKLVSEKQKIWPTDLINLGNSKKDKDQFNSFNHIALDFVNSVVNDAKKYPLIDLNDKETNFIIKYVETKGYFCGKESKTFNLLPYLINTPYGDSFQYPIEYDDGTKNTITTSYILEDETASLRIFIIQEFIQEEFIIFSYIDFEDITNFHIIDSIVHVNTSIMFKNIDKLPSSMGDLEEIVPYEFLDSNDIIDTIEDILSLHIVIGDRPMRTKMIKCTKRIPRTNSVKEGKNIEEEHDFVITRILKTTSDAKEYVARMTSNGYIDREYSIESWQRKGFYRRTRGGGSVWVEPTTCHRHLPLTEKELHIKL